MPIQVIDPKTIQDICDKIDSIPDCSTLAAYAQKQFDTWAKNMTDAISAKLSAAAKDVAPANLPEVITWITVHVNEAIAELQAALAAITQIAAAYATITAKITAKASALSCSAIPIPPLPIPPP